MSSGFLGHVWSFLHSSFPTLHVVYTNFIWLSAHLHEKNQFIIVSEAATVHYDFCIPQLACKFQAVTSFKFLLQIESLQINCSLRNHNFTGLDAIANWFAIHIGENTCLRSAKEQPRNPELVLWHKTTVWYCIWTTLYFQQQSWAISMSATVERFKMKFFYQGIIAYKWLEPSLMEGTPWHNYFCSK